MDDHDHLRRGLHRLVEAARSSLEGRARAACEERHHDAAHGDGSALRLRFELATRLDAVLLRFSPRGTAGARGPRRLFWPRENVVLFPPGGRRRPVHSIG
jgi:hypothetical protein